MNQECMSIRGCETLFPKRVCRRAAFDREIAIVSIESVAVFLVGVVLVVSGAELVLRGASRLAALLGIKPMIIGLTVVAMGTSAPELAVGITAAAEGRGALAVGNIAGTNVFNILFILGLSALIRPLPLHLRSIKLDLPVMIVAAIALVGMAWDGVLSRFEGTLLLGAAVLYTIVLVHLTGRERAAIKREFAEEYGVPSAGSSARSGTGMAWYVGLMVCGIAVTVWGADLLVSGAVGIARQLGVSDAIIGLTIVAIGTSAPELATTAVATFKDERDVAVGNLVGSSIYNILAILGITCIAAPDGVHVSREILLIDLPLAAAVAVVCAPVFTSDRLISRWEGAFFVVSYLAYLASLIVMRA